MSEPEEFQLMLNNEPFKLPLRFKYRKEISDNILDFMITHGLKYDVQSNVSREVFQSFANYLEEGTPVNITRENFLEFLHLSKEFEILGDVIESKKLEFGACFVNISSLKDQHGENTPFYEEEIATSLDMYLDQHGSDLMDIPIQSLYRIFTHKSLKLKDHDLAYTEIKKSYERSGNGDIFILLDTLDGHKLSEENLIESFREEKERCNHIPRVDFSYVSSLIGRNKTLEAKVNDLEHMIKESENQAGDENSKKQEYFTNQIQNLRDEHSKEISLLKEEHSVKMQEKLNEMQRKCEEHESYINTLKEAHSKEINLLEEKHNNEIKKLKEMHSKEIEGIQQQLSVSTQKMQEELSKEIVQNTKNELDINHLKEIEDIRKEHSKEIQNIQESQENKLKMLQEKYSSDINNLNEKHAKEIEDIRKEYLMKIYKMCLKPEKINHQNIFATLINKESKCKSHLLIASSSSGDIYNLINPNTRDYFSSSNISFLDIRIFLRDPIIVNTCKIYSASRNFPKSFNIYINDKIVKSIISAEELQIPMQPKEISFEKIKCRSFRFEQTDKNWEGESCIDIWKIELLEIQNGKSINAFQKLISENEDPHTWPLSIFSTCFDFNSFYKSDSKSNFCTNNEPNSYFQVELLKGLAILVGFRLRIGKSSQIRSFKIICTDDVNKPEESWIKAYESKNEPKDDFVKNRSFEKLTPPVRYIRLVQIGPNYDNDNFLNFYYFEVIGSYIA